MNYLTSSTRYQTGITNDQSHRFFPKGSWCGYYLIVISSLEPRIARGHTGCRAWITVQTYINDTLRCGPGSFRLRLFLFADRKSGEVRRENRPKAYVAVKEMGLQRRLPRRYRLTTLPSFHLPWLSTKPRGVFIFFECWNKLSLRRLRHVEYFRKESRETRLEIILALVFPVLFFSFFFLDFESLI